jgi:hypothetical protein
VARDLPGSEGRLLRAERHLGARCRRALLRLVAAGGGRQHADRRSGLESGDPADPGSASGLPGLRPPSPRWRPTTCATTRRRPW